MERATSFLICGICLTCLQSQAAATSMKMFPAMKKRLEAQKQAEETGLQGDARGVAIPSEVAAVSPLSVPVPAPVDIGKDGFPKLPEVSQILGGASSALKVVNTQANAIEARMLQAQSDVQLKLAKQKATFEAHLKKQEATNLEVTEQNANITSDIKSLRATNIALRKQAKGLQETNKMLRSEMHTLESRLGTARKFAGEAMVATDDSKEPKLAVLQTARSVALTDVGHDDDDEYSDDDEVSDEDDEVEDDEDYDELPANASSKDEASVPTNASATSFLQLTSDDEAALAELPDTDAIMQELSGTQDNSANSDDLLAILTKDVTQLAQQEKASEKQLKDIFVKDFRAGSARHKALLGQQKALLARRTEVETMQGQLRKAVAHLEATHEKLGQRLRGVGQFLKKLAHIANAHESELPKLLENLPKAVSLISKPIV